ncbi:MAG: maleylpyruvate isomerase N-terminal domain-containing protein [Chitinophagaceae bacterium]
MKPPIYVLPLFPLLNEKLISFLKQLSPAEWQRQTVAKQWVIKDVAAHLLDGNYRRIALHRDGWMAAPDVNINSYSDLVLYLNTLNADWVKATKRLSPAILIELLESTNDTIYEIFSKFDPFAIAAFPVSWAGETKSYNWFDIAREYTERWLHQQQIRDAVADKTILAKKLYKPFLNVFMQAWPFTLNSIDAAQNTTLKVVVTGIGEWYLNKGKEKWKIEYEPMGLVAAETIIDAGIAWKLFSKSVRKETIKESVLIKGDYLLGEKILDVVSVMA